MRTSDYDVRIDRATKWGNPFPVRVYGRKRCIEMYETYIRQKIEENPGLYDLGELHGRLGCWCAPLRCHGEVLIKLKREKHGEE